MIGELVVEDEVIVVTEEAHEACKYALGLSDANIALFESALADGTLFNKGPQSQMVQSLVLVDGMLMQTA